MGDSKPKVSKSKMFEQKKEQPLGNSIFILEIFQFILSKIYSHWNCYYVSIYFCDYNLFLSLNKDKPPPAKKVGGGKLTGALAAMKAEEAKMKEAEEQKKQIEEKMKAMKAEQEAKKVAAAEEKAAADADEEDEERDEDGSERGIFYVDTMFSIHIFIFNIKENVILK